MGLSYFYSFSAPADKTAAELEKFLQTVDLVAKRMGFDPTLVVNAKFDNPERQNFARQLTTGARLECDKLKGVVLLRDGQVWHHDPVTGSCRVIPKRGVVLVVTDEQRRETVFGFFQYPAMLQDLNDRDVVATHQGDRWNFQSFVNSPDIRFRQIVKLFAAAGYLDAERDEFKAA